MTREFDHRVARLLDRVIDLAPEEQRKVLDGLREHDGLVVREVEAILSQESSEPPGFLEQLHLSELDLADPSEDVTPLAGSTGIPTEIGPYRLLDRLGEGGMGEVWEAEQLEPIRRRVAVKLIRSDLVDSKAFLARFEAERQALALMEHPGIARLFDAGTTESRPYFAMEFVRGHSITEFCDRRQLSIRERLELFNQVCRAIHHAHQRGILHRDIKPNNILVTEADGGFQAKVIDFGIAKALYRPLTDEPFKTRLGDAVGTPLYMSPEQADEGALHIDSTSDVYSLGVVLYELLTGCLPFDRELLSAASPREMRRIVREEEPAPPSSRPRAGEADAIAAAEKRQTDVSGLVRALAGDLDWITLKALEKERARRYASASEFAADIERHLEYRPVAASPPGRWYRIGRFLRRHRVASLAATLALVALLLGTGLALWQASKAHQERAAAEQVTRFLVELFQATNPEEARGEETTARQVLDRAAARMEAELDGQPLLQARITDTIGELYWKLGLYGDAEALFRRAIGLWSGRVDEDDPRRAKSLSNLAIVQLLRGDYESSIATFEETLKLQEQRLGEDHEDVATTLSNLAVCWLRLERLDKAEPLSRRSLEIRQQKLAPESREIAQSLNLLASIDRRQGRFEESESHLRRAIQIIQNVEGPDHPDLSSLFSGLAQVYEAEGRYQDAVAAVREDLRISQKALGPQHPQLGVTWHNIAFLLMKQGEDEEAEAALMRTLEIFDASLRPGHPMRASPLEALGDLYLRRNIPSEAEEHYARAFAIREAAFEPDHPELEKLRRSYARALELNGRQGKARRILGSAGEP